MIQKIGQAISQKVRFNKNANSTALGQYQQSDTNQLTQNPIKSAPVDAGLLQKYYVSFGAKSSGQPSKQEILEGAYSQSAEDLVDSAAKIAKKYGHAEINETHILKASLESIMDYMKDIDDGEKVFDPYSVYQLPAFFSSATTDNVFKEPKEMAKIKPVIENEIKLLDDTLSKQPKSDSDSKTAPQPSKKLINGLNDYYSVVCAESGAEESITDSMFLVSILAMDQKQSDNKLHKLLMKLNETFMSDGGKHEDSVHLSAYDDKAKNILKNLSLGTNMFITHDANTSPKYLVDSVVDVLENQKKEFGKINAQNTQITILNKNIKQNFFIDKALELSRDKNSNHIIVLNLRALINNSAQMVKAEDGSHQQQARLSEDFFELVKNTPKNVKFIFIEEKNGYYATMADPDAQKVFENFGEIPFPVLSTDQAKKAFKEQPLLMKTIEKLFSKAAVDSVIEASAQLDGNYPAKAQKLMKKLATYYVDKKEISEKDVKEYVREAKDLFKTAGEDSSVEVVFDTGKKLKDLMGKDATKKEAEAIVKQIKKGTLGTKGAIIYSQDGSVGSGRRFTAKAIAGEVKAPYIEINALDFGTKDVDIFGGGALSPEASIKKLFSIVKAQAEANANKSAILYIENFEYFSVGDLVSEYHQKAMSQMLREMDSAEKKGLNVLVLGSVNDPESIGESTIKSFKFIDKIEVESPSGNINARTEILENAIKKNNLKIAGKTEAEKAEVIKLMAETTKGFPMVYLINLISKIKTVAIERGHKAVDKTDVVEAYLQLTTGRPASSPVSKHYKDIVTSHECGHALNIEVMANLAQKENIPWHMPSRVNFITLDPRGSFGGAMYPKYGGNEEHSFETTFSQLVCDLGGHSAEKHFYQIDGSYGITSDLKMATTTAEFAVQYMGQGRHTGKRSVAGMLQKPDGQTKQNMDKDADVLLKNSLIVSDLITEYYADFNKEFTKKYADKVGTGECLIHGDVFRAELKAWIEKQSPEKRADLELVDKTILMVIDGSKRGIEAKVRR